MIELTKPLVSFDIESTGLDTQNDRIVELCMIKIETNKERIVKTKRFNPEIPIPKQASDVHGITYEMVANEPTFRQMAKGIYEFIQGADILGYNSNSFDVPMLNAEFERAGIIWDYSDTNFYDAGNIFKRQEQRTLEAALMFYCGRELEGAHGAQADTEATIDVFFNQIEKYKDLPDTNKELSLYCNYDKEILDLSGKFSLNEDGKIILNFGQKKGELAKDNISYIQWMYYKASFANDTRRICEQILNGN